MTPSAVRGLWWPAAREPKPVSEGQVREPGWCRSWGPSGWVGLGGEPGRSDGPQQLNDCGGAGVYEA